MKASSNPEGQETLYLHDSDGSQTRERGSLHGLPSGGARVIGARARRIFGGGSRQLADGEQPRHEISEETWGHIGAAAEADGLRRSDWLFGEVDRKRLLDMDQRLVSVIRETMALIIVALLVASPWIGFWELAPAFAAAVVIAVSTRYSRRAVHPERMIFAAWLSLEVIIAASVALLGGGSSLAALSWIAIPVVTLPARFPGRPLKVGVLVSLGLLAAVAFGTSTHAVLNDPVLVGAPALLIVAVTLLSTALMRSEIEHRDRCVIDPLTGMLNRGALESRPAELEQQSEITGDPVGVIVADLDHFKDINDTKGHTTGDEVLSGVAERIRGQLRAFDLVYRFGGEEFVVLVPGAELRETERIAESLRHAIATTDLGNGQHVTLSCGASASERGRPFKYKDVFAAADAALYEAKRGGRDRVYAGAVAGLQPHPLLALENSAAEQSAAALS
jgi:diguanylate cyclase (GGDEF)-like protein